MLITHGRIATFGKNPQVIDDGAIYDQRRSDCRRRTHLPI